MTSGRVIVLSAVALAVQTILLASVVAWEFGVFGPSRSPFVSDFPSFYAAGSLALQGLPELAYDETAHWFAEQAIGGEGPYVYFFYPPPFLLLCAPLALLPYWVAFGLFEAASLAAYTYVACRIAGPKWCLPALAFPAVFWCAGLGQNSFLTAALFGAATLLVDRRPIGSGALFGLLCYKPHFGLLVPIALAAGGHWRAFFATGATLCGVIGATVGLFGFEPWLRYTEALSAAARVYGSDTILLAGYVSPFGAARLAGMAAGEAMTLQLLVSLATAAIVARVWQQKTRQPLRAAVLIGGTLLSVPVALLYDLTLVSICIAWLVRDAAGYGFLPGEKWLLTIIYLLAFITLGAGWLLHDPAGVFAPAIILGVSLRRAKMLV
nr:glycosyltransferase family 87 protein [uncultured Rhodopila sp.]